MAHRRMGNRRPRFLLHLRCSRIPTVAAPPWDIQLTAPDTTDPPGHELLAMIVFFIPTLALAAMLVWARDPHAWNQSQQSVPVSDGQQGSHACLLDLAYRPALSRTFVAVDARLPTRST